MCTTCGCGAGQALIGGQALRRQHKPDGPMRFHSHEADMYAGSGKTTLLVKTIIALNGT